MSNRRITTTDKLPANCEEIGNEMITIIKWIKDVKNIKNENIINSHETPVFMENIPNYTFEDKQLKQTRPVISFENDKDKFTVMFSFTGEGNNHLTPFIILKGKDVQRLVKNKEILTKCHVHANENGWMNGELLKIFIEEVIIPYTKKEWCLLLWDTLPHITIQI